MKLKILFIIAVFALFPIIIFPQQPTPTTTPMLYSEQTLKDLAQIQQSALSSDYAYRQTAYLTNNIGPRLSGSAQAQRAVEYVADEMKKLGLEVRVQLTGT